MIELPSKPTVWLPGLAPPPVENETGASVSLIHLRIAGVIACFPNKCLPAAVSHNQGTVWETDAVIATTDATPSCNTAGAAGALGGGPPPLALPKFLGGGPWYLLWASCRKGHDLALQALYAKNIHGCFAFWAGVISLTLTISAVRGVVSPPLGVFGFLGGFGGFFGSAFGGTGAAGTSGLPSFLSSFFFFSFFFLLWRLVCFGWCSRCGIASTLIKVWLLPQLLIKRCTIDLLLFQLNS